MKTRLFWASFLFAVLYTLSWFYSSYYSGTENGILQFLPRFDQHKLRLNSKSFNLSENQNEFKYIMKVPNKNPDTPDLVTAFGTPWKRNLTNLQNLRSDLKNAVKTEMILSKETTEEYQRFDFLFDSGSIKISQDFYKMLPRTSPLKQKYKRCSVVGSGAILKGSNCGNEIDRADFVIRGNLPPIKPFRDDAGSKSNLTTVNPSVVKARFGRLFGGFRKSALLDVVNQYNEYLCFWSFGQQWMFPLSIKVNEFLMERSEDISVEMLHGNPNHFRDVRDFWKKRGVPESISTGFYMTTMAVLSCDEIHLYGFWPFSIDIRGRPITSYHYYEKHKVISNFHSFDAEFQTLVSLHTSGVLQLHVDDCNHN